MKEGYVIAVALVAAVVMVFAEDHPIRPIPTECPLEDNENYTVHIAHKTDCTKFYTCFRGEPIEMVCPFRNKKGDRLHFNALLQVCDWPGRAGCQNPVEATTETPKDTWNSTWTCRNADGNTMLPHETRCYLYYTCNGDGSSTVHECAEGLHFDPYLQRCVLAAQSRCPIKGPCRDYHSNEGTFYPDVESCKHVYFCKKTSTFHYACDTGAEWSVDVGKCIPNEQSNCVRRTYDY